MIKANMLGNENVAVQGTNGTAKFDFLISKNERIRFTKNNYRLGFTNGDIGFVRDIKKLSNGSLNLVIERDDGHTLLVNTKEYSDQKGRCYLIPSYAQTIYSSQGLTVDGNVFVLNSPFIDRKNAYVAMSRHKDECHLYAGMAEIEGASQIAQADTFATDYVSNLAKQYSKDKSASLAISYPVKEQSLHFSHSLNMEAELG